MLGGSPIGEVAARYGTSRQTLHSCRRRFEQEGIPGLLDRSRRPRNSPTRLSAEVEAEICELRRRHPRWGARRISHELSGRGLESAPSPATVHRVLSRNGLVRAQERQHLRKYRRWQREAPMHLRQMDLVARRQLLGSSPAAGDAGETSSVVPRSVRRSARTTVSVEHADNQSASRTRWPRHPPSPVVLEDLRKAGAAKAEGAPPLSQAQVELNRIP
ncbi:helix-turn-helix domain-containing protein [Streptomyces sp. H27-C3]|uniref:helix-turn-helix domain-containing protein n=1 Tax=Streptomyces sp. H27-C3 TaxID=3046305 RepID=UPI0024BAAFC2|nr:helix-turn-helix domain-containing protein [Streptomyces sp. H27-C3]MDJ0464232.1 helix-turn-helix domain-containing protein [Streptomyces sp. H27-C3]